MVSGRCLVSFYEFRRQPLIDLRVVDVPPESAFPRWPGCAPPPPSDCRLDVLVIWPRISTRSAMSGSVTPIAFADLQRFNRPA